MIETRPTTPRPTVTWTACRPVISQYSAKKVWAAGAWSGEVGTGKQVLDDVLAIFQTFDDEEGDTEGQRGQERHSHEGDVACRLAETATAMAKLE